MSELSRAIGVNKSKLSYYVVKGVLVPESTVSGMYLFEEGKVKRDLAFIEKHQAQDYTLVEIKALMKKRDKSKK